MSFDIGTLLETMVKTTDDQLALAAFLDGAAAMAEAMGERNAARGWRYQARQARRRSLDGLVEKHIKNALGFDREHKLLDHEERKALATRLIREHLDSDKPHDALVVAREENLRDLAHEAALAYVKKACASEYPNEVELLRIVDVELRDDSERCRPIIQLLYKKRARYPSQYASFGEFARRYAVYLTREQVDLAEFLANAAEASRR